MKWSEKEAGTTACKFKEWGGGSGWVRYLNSKIQQIILLNYT